MKNWLSTILLKLLIKVSGNTDQVRILNARKISDTIVDEWVTWVDQILRTDRDSGFKMNITNKSWFGFTVLKEQIESHILSGEEVKQ